MRSSSSRDRGDGPVEFAQMVGDEFDDAVAAQAAGGHVQLGRDLVQMPADPALHPGALADQVVAMVDLWWLARTLAVGLDPDVGTQ